MADLGGKTVVITGASKGIGAAITEVMIEAGATVIAHYGGDRAGAEVATSRAKRGQATLLSADFSDMGAVDDFWAQAHAAAGGRIDVLVNNAGIMRQSGGILDPIEDWDAIWSEAMAVNLHAPARLLAASTFNQYSSHSFGCGRKEVAPAVPMLRFVDINQPNVGVVYQRRGLKRLAGLFIGHLASGEFA